MSYATKALGVEETGAKISREKEKKDRSCDVGEGVSRSIDSLNVFFFQQRVNRL